MDYPYPYSQPPVMSWWSILMHALLLCLALVVALFSHAYIWVHYFCTDRPDMKLIYGSE